MTKNNKKYLPDDFDEKVYLELNPDVANAIKNGTCKGAFEHYKEFGFKEGRPLKSRKSYFLKLIDESGAGLEIGPSHRPVTPKSENYNCQILDHLNENDLKKKYKNHDVNLNNIEKVDYVWDGTPIDKLIGKRNHFDYIIASHVIEHVPDFISFLQQCENLLSVNGILSLAIPDKRYCFDFFSPITTTGMIIDAFLEKAVKPSPGRVFDHFSNAAQLDEGEASIAWSENSGLDRKKLIHTMSQAIDQYSQSLNIDKYIDCHNWRFVPASFCLLISDLRELKLTNLDIAYKQDTIGHEFFVSLKINQVSNKNKLPSRMSRLQEINESLN